MSTKNIWLWLGGAAVVIVLGIGLWSMRPDEPSAQDEYMSSADSQSGNGLPENENTPVTEAVSPAPAASKPAPAKTPTKTTATPDDSYQKAMNTYDYRIQFVNCRGVIAPGIGTLSMKKNSKFMLDNRDKKAHVIAFAGQSHTIAAEDFYIASIAKSGSYNLTCDGGGSVKINIED